MSYYNPQRTQMRWSFGGALTPAVKTIIITCVVFFVIQLISKSFTYWLRLDPQQILSSGTVWQLVTYMFLHGGLFHIFINMLILFLFGGELERMWGTRFFVQYYLICGIGAGIFALFAGYPVVGASGAIYGLLVAFAMYFPNRVIYMNVLLIFFFPIRAKYFVIIMGAIAFLSSLGGASGISHLAHLGGLAVGYVYLRLGGVGRRRAMPSGNLGMGDSIKQAYHRWRMKRLKKKFERYYEERTGGENSKYKYH
jgi:membrane associated rhomboid family serine protease